MLKPILDCQPAELLRACYEQATDVGIDEVRAFLAQRPTNALAHDYVSWGGLVEMLLLDVFNRKMVQGNDLHCVHDYLDSVSGWFGQQEASNADWLELDSMFGLVHASLDEVLHLLLKTSRMPELALVPCLFTQEGWEPETLLVNLQRALADSSWLKKSGHAVNSALCLGATLMVQTDWQPQHSNAWAGLWVLQEPQDYENWNHYHHAVRTILAKIPLTLPAALHRLATDQQQLAFQPNSVDPYFPLCLEECEPKALVNGLGALMEAANPHVRGRIETLLREHHPRLGQVMAMHYTLATEPCANFDHLEVALRQILEHGPVECVVEHGMGALFEDAR